MQDLAIGDPVDRRDQRLPICCEGADHLCARHTGIAGIDSPDAPLVNQRYRHDHLGICAICHVDPFSADCCCLLPDLNYKVQSNNLRLRVRVPLYEVTCQVRPLPISGMLVIVFRDLERGSTMSRRLMRASLVACLLFMMSSVTPANV